MELMIAAVVIGVVALLFLARHHHEVNAMDVEQKALGIDPERQFRRPPNEGDLL